MIIATAGHIDHGKTALVKALTGVDTDRLPEEKARGITVDLGFAYAGEAASLGFVDVPGHEKLVRTMVAGATGVDFVMLVVAADDGVMPQTREHLAILDLLGIGRGVAVITKADTAEAARLGAVEAEVRRLLEGTTLAGVPCRAVSALGGEGIAELHALLGEAARVTPARRGGDGFRMAIDRAFTLQGAGIVVTGTVHAGSVAVGDRLMLTPLGREVRVRGIHAQNRSAAMGETGQRCALNIAGARVELAAIARGDWIVAADLHAPTATIDARLRLLGGARALRHWTPVHVHSGAADIPGRVALLEAGSLAGGGEALVRLVLDRPTAAHAGDRFVIRDQSAQQTLGGGVVIDPLPPARHARKPERLALLRALDRADDGEAFACALGSSPLGLDLERFAVSRNIAPERLAAIALPHDGVIGGAARVRLGGRMVAFARAGWEALRADVLAALAAYQEANPDAFGATASQVLRASAPALRAAGGAALEALVAERAIVRFGQLLHLPGHTVRLTQAEENLAVEVEGLLGAAGLDPPRLAMLAERLQLSEEELRPLLEKLGRMGRLRRVGRAYFLLPRTLGALAEAVRLCVEAHPQGILTVGQFREQTGIGRHATMPVLEFLDRIGFTTRHQDGRRLRASGAGIFAPAEAAAA